MQWPGRWSLVGRRRGGGGSPRPAGSSGRRRLVVRAVVGGVAVCAAVLLILLATLPDTRALERGWPERTAYMEGWLKGADRRSVTYRPVPLSRIPQGLIRAVLVSEDAGFYGHSGFDWQEVRAALRQAWEEKRPPRGASTITQQLARNVYLSPSRNPLRKAREALIARRLEATLSKNRILELYLNVIELGPGLYGVEAAAHRYFGKSVSGLTPREAAEIAGTIPSPRFNNPSTRTRGFSARAARAYARAFGNERIEVTVEPIPFDSVPAVDPPAIELRTLDSARADDTLPAVDTLEVDTRDVDTLPAVDTLPGGDTLPGDDTPPGRAPPQPAPAPPSKNGSHFSRGDSDVRRLTTTRSPIEIRTPGITM